MSPALKLNSNLMSPRNLAASIVPNSARVVHSTRESRLEFRSRSRWGYFGGFDTPGALLWAEAAYITAEVEDNGGGLEYPETAVVDDLWG